MNKTNKLFEKYLGLYLEQEPGEAPLDEEDMGDVSPGETDTPQEPAPGPKPMSENEKYIIQILTNAFVFNRKNFNPTMQGYINTKINQLTKTVNRPVSQIVDDIKKIISLDKSLTVESKTSNLLKKYIKLIEQGEKDATEPQASDDLAKKEPEIAKPNPADNKAKLSLSEFFPPFYKELIIKALKHSPNEDELAMIKTVVDEFIDVDPQKIVDAIKKMLNQALEDKEVEEDLGNL